MESREKNQKNKNTKNVVHFHFSFDLAKNLFRDNETECAFEASPHKISNNLIEILHFS